MNRFTSEENFRQMFHANQTRPLSIPTTADLIWTEAKATKKFQCLLINKIESIIVRKLKITQRIIYCKKLTLFTHLTLGLHLHKLNVMASALVKRHCSEARTPHSHKRTLTRRHNRIWYKLCNQYSKFGQFSFRNVFGFRRKAGKSS